MWEDDIKIILFREMGYEGKRWMELTQNRVQWRTLVLASYTTSRGSSYNSEAVVVVDDA